MSISRFLKNMTVAVGVAAASLAATTSAHAVSLSEITARGKVKIGVLTGAPPMGMVDEKGNPSGYDVDVANLIGSYLSLPVELVPLTPPARIPALQTGKVDFLVATLAPTGERAKTVMFTQPYSAFNMDIISGKDQKFENLDSLKGKRVSVNRGSSQETALRKANVEGLEIVVFLRRRFHQRPGSACGSGRCRRPAVHGWRSNHQAAPGSRSPGRVHLLPTG